MIENDKVTKTLKEMQVIGNQFELPKSIILVCKERKAIHFERATNLKSYVCVERPAFFVKISNIKNTRM